MYFNPQQCDGFKFMTRKEKHLGLDASKIRPAQATPEDELNKRDQQRAERERRGRGARQTYVPYIQVKRGEFSSRGRSHIFTSPFFRRSHHLLSDLELHTLLRLMAQTPLDIREQFPLDWNGSRSGFSRASAYAPGTVEIAAALGFKHPAFSKRDPMRMTTDLLVQRRDGRWTAYHVKYEADLADERTSELRAIERVYWRERCVEFKVATEQDVNRVAIENLTMAHSYDREAMVRVGDAWFEPLVKAARSHSMQQVTHILANEFGGSPTMHANTIKFGIATGVLQLDLGKGQLDWTEVWPAIKVKLP
jgi:hypothetical protein